MDYEGPVIRFKDRIVDLVNNERPKIDFGDTFDPVARISSFRILLALAAIQGLQLYGGDANTTYLKSWLTGKQYISIIDGYPCKTSSYMYVVHQTLWIKAIW